VARSLRSQPSHTLGLVVSAIRNPFFPLISGAVEDVAYEQGFSVFLCHTDDNPEKEAISLHLLRDEHIAGVICSPTRPTLANFTAAHLNYPLVVIDRSLSIGDVDVVVLDHVDSAYRLTTHLVEHCSQRIAALCGEMRTPGPERRAGDEMDFILGQAPTTQMGILGDCTGGGRPCGRMALLHEPSRLIAQPTDEIGKTATALLLQRVADSDRPPRQGILKGQLLVRGSSTPRW